MLYQILVMLKAIFFHITPHCNLLNELGLSTSLNVYYFRWLDKESFEYLLSCTTSHSSSREGRLLSADRDDPYG